MTEPKALGSYVAKHCPVRAQFDNHPDTRDLPRPEPDPVQQLIIDEGNEFERHVEDELRRSLPDDDLCFADDDIATTTKAIKDRVPVIVGAQLPTVDRRSGKPDLLLAHPDGGYVPADIKHHKTQAAADKKNPNPATVSPLDDPWDRSEPPGVALRKHAGDAFQLAHYWNMLVALGWAPPDDVAAVGAIVGKEREFTWYELTAEIWKTRSTSQRADPDDPNSPRKATSVMRSTLERYRHEFEFRAKVIDTAAAADPGDAWLLDPVKIGECATCPWWTVICADHLDHGGDAGDHISLLPHVGWNETRRHHHASIHTCGDLADLDLRTATLLAARHPDDRKRVPVTRDDLMAEPGADRDQPAVNKRAKRKQRLFESQGITTVGQLRDAQLDGDLIDRYLNPAEPDMVPENVPIRLAELVIAARARIRGGLHRTGPVPDDLRAQIEIDIDMESDLGGGVYLWGAIRTDRTDPTAPRTGGYQPFVDWAYPLTERQEGQVLARFWAWLTDQLADADTAAVTAKVYCWNEQAEAGQLANIAARTHGTVAGVPSPTDIETLVKDTNRWVDLKKTAEMVLLSPAGYGLKAIAPHAGFAWPTADAAGDLSAVWYRHAVNPDHADDAVRLKEKLLDYNAADVYATLAVRDWLTSHAFTGLPSARELEQHPPAPMTTPRETHTTDADH